MCLSLFLFAPWSSQHFYTLFLPILCLAQILLLIFLLCQFVSLLPVGCPQLAPCMLCFFFCPGPIPASASIHYFSPLCLSASVCLSTIRLVSFLSIEMVSLRCIKLENYTKNYFANSSVLEARNVLLVPIKLLVCIKS